MSPETLRGWEKPPSAPRRTLTDLNAARGETLAVSGQQDLRQEGKPLIVPDGWQATYGPFREAGWLEVARNSAESEATEKYRRCLDLRMSTVKGWCSGVGNDLFDEAIQLLCDMGFVEEAGVAQLERGL